MRVSFPCVGGLGEVYAGYPRPVVPFPSMWAWPLFRSGGGVVVVGSDLAISWPWMVLVVLVLRHVDLVLVFVRCWCVISLSSPAGCFGAESLMVCAWVLRVMVVLRGVFRRFGCVFYAVVLSPIWGEGGYRCSGMSALLPGQRDFGVM